MNRLTQPVCAGEFTPSFYTETNYDLVGEEFINYMEFRLVYEGSLPSGNNPKPIEQHAIRKQLHSQLKILWQEHPALQSYHNDIVNVENDSDHSFGLRQIFAEELSKGKTFSSLPYCTYHDYLATLHQKCNLRFVPLVHKKLDLVCELDILFLRRSNPGELVKHGGDLDNRIKTLFDALKIPETCSGLPLSPPTSDENPFYCLLQDDSLITSVNVTTDKLLTSKKSDAGQHDVCLILHVTVKAAAVSILNLPLA